MSSLTQQATCFGKEGDATSKNRDVVRTNANLLFQLMGNHGWRRVDLQCPQGSRLDLGVQYSQRSWGFGGLPGLQEFLRGLRSDSGGE